MIENEEKEIKVEFISYNNSMVSDKVKVNDDKGVNDKVRVNDDKGVNDNTMIDNTMIDNTMIDNTMIDNTVVYDIVIDNTMIDNTTLTPLINNTTTLNTFINNDSLEFSSEFDSLYSSPIVKNISLDNLVSSPTSIISNKVRNESINIYDHIASNIHNKLIDLFSNESYITNKKYQVFRIPGEVSSSIPIISIENSVISEMGVTFFFKITTTTALDKEVSWYTTHLFTDLYKSKEELGREILLIEKDYATLNTFTMTNISEIIYKRSNYLIFNQKLVKGLILNNHLVLFTNRGNPIKEIQLKIISNKVEEDSLIKKVEDSLIRLQGDKQFLINEDLFELSCEIERNEWVRIIEIEINK